MRGGHAACEALDVAAEAVGNHRLILNAMLFRLATGIPWRDLPERYGPWQTVYARFRRWCRSGLWDRILSSLQRALKAAGAID